MTPQDIQTIHQLLMKRVVPQNAEEGVAIAQLAQRLATHFTPPRPREKTAEEIAEIGRPAATNGAAVHQ